MTSAIDPSDDLVRPFQIDPFGLRGRLVRLGAVIERVMAAHAYPDAVAGLLGEAVALAALLAGALKYEGIFTLQAKGDGAIRLLVADVTSEGAIRAYAQFDPAALEKAAALPISSVPRLLGAGYLAFTVDQGEHTERYQGIVELVGATLADCAHHYFRQSEQIEAGIRVAATRTAAGWRAGGIMIQRLPPASGEGIESRLSFQGEIAAEAEDDGWRRALLLLGTCTDAELTDPAMAGDTLLLRLFHEDGVRVWPGQQLEARCRCSRERIRRVLASLPEDDLASLAVDGEAEVVCEFCSTRYRFTDAEIQSLGRPDGPAS
jgi:molecular chaperone Hsp33